MGRKKNEEIKDLKEESLSETLKRHFGKEIIFSGELDRFSLKAENIISTGSLALDIALGTGGIPTGKIVEMYGPESSGKTSLMYSIIAQAQQLKKNVLYIDTEHAYDKKYARSFGVNLAAPLFTITQPDSLEQAADIILMCAGLGKIDLICLDSYAGSPSEAELEGSIQDQQVSVGPRVLAKLFRKVVPVLDANNVALIISNQIRDKIGVVYGSKESTPGGHAIKHHASVRLDLRKIEVVKQSERPIAQRIRIKVAKNKLASPYQEAEALLMFNKGFSLYDDLKTIGVATGVIEQSGTFLKYKSSTIGQGRDIVNETLNNDPKLKKSIISDIYTNLDLLT